MSLVSWKLSHSPFEHTRLILVTVSIRLTRIWSNFPALLVTVLRGLLLEGDIYPCQAQLLLRVAVTSSNNNSSRMVGSGVDLGTTRQVKDNGIIRGRNLVRRALMQGVRYMGD